MAASAPLLFLDLSQVYGIRHRLHVRGTCYFLHSSKHKTRVSLESEAGPGYLTHSVYSLRHNAITRRRRTMRCDATRYSILGKDGHKTPGLPPPPYAEQQPSYKLANKENRRKFAEQIRRRKVFNFEPKAGEEEKVG